MDYRNFSPNKFYVDESLQPQGPRRPRTSTPRGRRPNLFQNSPDGFFGGSASPPTPSERPWNKSWRRSNDSWRSRDSSRNSSFNSPCNSPGQRFHRGFRSEQDLNTSFGLKNIAAYYHPSMMENPWLHLEEAKASDSILSVSLNAESAGSSESDKINESSDQEASSPDVLIESITEHSQDSTKDEDSLSATSSSQKSSS